MLTIQQIKQNKNNIIQALQHRGIQDIAITIEKILTQDKEQKSTQQKLEDTNNKLKKNAQIIGQYIKAKNTAQAIAQKKEYTESLKKEKQKYKQKIDTYSNEINKLLVNLPNTLSDKVPLGKNSKDNKIVYQKKFVHALPKTTLPHWELASKYDIIDFTLGTKIASTGFPVYKNAGAQLQRALIQFFLAEAIKNNYQEIIPPLLVNSQAAFSTGQLPDKEGQMYKIQDHDLYLIPTAEVPLTNLYKNKIIEEKNLPIKNVAYTPCFRREAGSWGSNVRGLNRLHQFDKVEIIAIHTPQQSDQALADMTNHVQNLLNKLALTYRKILLCSGDLGFTATCTYDFEVYSPGQDKWLEVSSVSNFATYQSNRLKLKYKDTNNKKHLAHTLNGSALALPRVIAAIIETYQTEDQGIQIPKVLQPYMNTTTMN